MGSHQGAWYQEQMTTESDRKFWSWFWSWSWFHSAVWAQTRTTGTQGSRFLSPEEPPISRRYEANSAHSLSPPGEGAPCRLNDGRDLAGNGTRDLRLNQSSSIYHLLRSDCPLTQAWGKLRPRGPYAAGQALKSGPSNFKKFY